MSLFTSMKKIRHRTEALVTRRAVPLAALIVTTAVTIPVFAVGMDEFTITDGEKTEIISLYKGDVEAAVAQSSFDEKDYFISGVTASENGYDVNVKHNYHVTITADGKTNAFYTSDARVSSILRRAGITMNEDDLVIPEENTKITKPSEIVVTRVTHKTETMTRAIPFTIENKETAELEIGRTRVAQKGIDGLEEITLEYTYHDGQLAATAQTNSKVIKEAVTEIIENGTKQPSVTTAGGRILAYSNVLTVEATAYSGGGRTASGMSAQVGRIAVDPRVIPLGTKLYITSTDGTSWVYGEAVAADTGGAIKGNRIDLYFNSESECNRFGRRSAKVYILK